MQQGWSTADIPDQTGRIAVVTGSNRGLGLIVARELARAGADVIVATRSIERGQAAARQLGELLPDSRVTAMELDLADLGSVRRFTERLRESRPGLDLLVNNATIAIVPRSTTVDGFEAQLGTNYLGHFALTALLLDQLRRRTQPRVVTVSAEMHRMATIRFDDLQSERSYSRWRAYWQSKLALLSFALELDRRLRTAGIPMRSVAAHPGVVSTHLEHPPGTPLLDRLFMTLMNRFTAKNPEVGALALLYAATAPTIPEEAYIGPGRQRPPSAKALDRELANRLWSISEALTDVSYDLSPSSAGAR